MGSTLVSQRTTENGRTASKQFEVDFVANQGNHRYYIQSALALPTPEKTAQETASLRGIRDSFKKIIVIRDDIKPKRDEAGILTINLFDFLLKQESLDW